MEAFTDLSYLKTFYKQGTKHLEGEHPGRPLNIPRMRRPMIVATRAARTRGERRLPKFLFPMFPRWPEDVRKEEMK